MQPAVSYSLPEGTAPDDLLTALRDRLGVSEGRPASSDRTAHDTADRRLRRAGVELWRESGELVLREPGERTLSVRAPRRTRYLIGDLPEGELRDRLAAVVEMRALVPLVRVRSRVRPLSVLDADGNAMLVLELETARATAGGRSEPLGARLHVRGVAGHDEQFARAERVLGTDLGLAVAGDPLADAALRAVGGDPRGIRGKIKVDLDPAVRADEAALRLLNALADVTEANLPGTLDDVDTEFLHQLRVSLRRARSVLRELKAVFPPEDLARHRRELRWIQGVTGPVRDLDVQLLEWEELTRRVSGAAREDLGPVRDLLAVRRARELRAMRRELRGSRFRREWAAWRAFLRGPLSSEAGRPAAALPVREVAARRIRRVYGRMVRDGSRIDGSSPAEDLHELRKRGKELRYLLELFGGLFASDVVAPMLASLKDLQDVLGLHQDRAVQVESLRALARDVTSETGGSDAPLALAVVIERLEAEQRDARAGFADRFAAFSSKRQRKVVRRTFGARS